MIVMDPLALQLSCTCVNGTGQRRYDLLARHFEQALGRATTGKERLLDVVPVELHQKTPLIFGSRDEVDRVGRLYTGCDLKGERSPLFGRRGLFRAFS